MFYRIAVQGSTTEEAGRHAVNLQQSLREISDDIEAEREKAGTDTMDLGSIVTVLVSSGGAITFAKGLADWLRRRQGARITIWEGKNSVVAENLTSDDAVRLMEMFRGR